jgi:tetratricopeptide (TPR) repeat protein
METIIMSCPAPASRRKAGRNRLRAALAAAMLALCGAPAALSATLEFLPEIAPEAAAGAPVLTPEAGATLSVADRSRLSTATAAFGDGDLARAEELLRTILSTAPDDPDVLHLLGLVLANQSRFDAALDALSRAAEGYDRNAAPLVIIGDIHLATGRIAEARAAFEAAVARDPAAWQAQESLARIAESEGRISDAMDLFARAIAGGPSDRLFPRLQLARLALVDDRPEIAESILAPVLAAGVRETAVLDLAARAHLARGDTQAARPLLVELVDRGDSPFGHVGLARLELADSRADAAVALIATARARWPANPDLALEEGNILGAMRRYDAALAAYEAGLSQAPDNAALLRGSSRALLRLGRVDDALARAQAAAAARGATDADHVWLAAVAEQAGDVALARMAYETALGLGPDNVLALNNLAALVTADDPARAVDLATRADALAPGTAAIRDTLGWAYYAAGDLAAARRIFETLVQEDPDSALAAYRLGKVRLAAGDHATGRADLRRALDLDPQFPYAAEARAVLGGN